MKVEYINPFVTSTTTVFSTMLSWSLKRMPLTQWPQPHPKHEISGIVGLSGQAVGTVVLSLERDVALSATEAMLGIRPDQMDEDVVDAIGELANMIAGSAKTQLEQFAMSISLPNVIVGKHHMIRFPSTATPICIPFDSDRGKLCLVVGLEEQQQEVSIPRYEHANC